MCDTIGAKELEDSAGTPPGIAMIDAGEFAGVVTHGNPPSWNCDVAMTYLALGSRYIHMDSLHWGVLNLRWVWANACQVQ